MLSLRHYASFSLTSTRHRAARRLICRGVATSASRHQLLSALTARGFIADITHRDEFEKESQRPRPHRLVAYSGVDPTADAFHVGHLVPLMCLLHFQIHGHRIISLIGGATGLVGDPSGRIIERQLARTSAIEGNVSKLTSGIEKFFEKALKYASSRTRVDPKECTKPEILNNLTWHKDMSMLRFLREVGSVNRVNTMLARESVQTRMNSASGLTFTEFTYQLLQAYDFYELRRQVGCRIQIGGSDQWGNIVAGIDLINRLGPPNEKMDPSLQTSEGASPQTDTTPRAYGITTPLLTTANGEKFGKSAGNAVWLDKEKTSPFDFYQFWLRTADADVERYLKLFTLLPLTRIEDVMAEQRAHPQKRPAQQLLAREVSELVHGATGTSRALSMTDVLYGSGDQFESVTADQIIASMEGDGRLRFVSEAELFSKPLMVLSKTHGLTRSGGAAKTLAKTNGFYVNGHRRSDVYVKLKPDELIDGRVAVMRTGKRNTVVLVRE
ncbi:hypothetical protein PUNSTDRAFT_62081 [Punctularia strigosozonata HHB-11173 SS5]|uniref:uncharacterized protein n=1 Tax=Punctularia strigosozonata (strain HHB-11173) TaxID=741275 RepID=UPI0004416DA3|nr:uncharacterized protein PUNSTDRAFT_62081 [Punctularia strigosozonata HHB-11173 SS5]EIN11684.1 hypothetical protein PUNSTDRAFT_62081 [Punctularia strigosozonata HHB-11173 SS5]